MQFRDLMSRLDSISEDTVATMPVHMDQASLDKLKSSNPALFQQILKTNPEMAMALQSPNIGQTATPTPATTNAVAPQGPTATPGQQTTSGNTSSQVPAKQPTGTIGSDDQQPQQGKRPQESYDAFKKSMGNVVEELTNEDEPAKIPRWKKAWNSLTTSDADKQAQLDAEINAKIQGWIDRVQKNPKEFSNVPPEIKRQVQKALPSGPAKDNALLDLHLERNKRDLATATDAKDRARLEAERKDILARKQNVLAPPEKTEVTPPAGETADQKAERERQEKLKAEAEAKERTEAEDKKKKEEEAAKKTPKKTDVTTTDAGDGPTGLALAKLNVSRAQRRDQAFVDQQFGAGKFKAGSAESNLALLDKAKKGEIKGPEAAVVPPAVVAQPPAAVVPPAVVAQPPAAVVPPAEVDSLQAARDRQAQARADAEAIRRADIIAKYKDLDPTKAQARTGNYGKAYYDLKDGDIDYDKDGRKIVYTKNGSRGPGEWSVGSFADHGFTTSPGLGVIGPSWNSPEGQAIVKSYQNRTLNPDEHDVMKDYWAKNPPKAVVAPAPEVAQLQARNTGGGFDGRNVPKNLALPKPYAGVDLGLTDADRARPVPRKSDGAIDLGVTDADMKNAPRNPDGSVKLESIVKLDSVVEELMEWGMSDRIHPDVPYTGWDAATDAGIAGLGALATYATGGLAAPVAGAATVARGGRLANMLYKGYQGTKNVVQGAKAIATNPEARALANQATSKVKLAKGAGTALAGDAATSIGLSTAADKLDQVANDLEKPKAENESYKTELDRITYLAKR
jgi:hypothetical protein